MHKTSAWPLAWIYVVLVVYASLYPFSDWRDQGMAPWTFLTAPLPKYWTWFDVLTNVLGYAPLGFLLALSAARTHRVMHGVVAATVAATLLSLLLETMQGYLPVRVPSNVDLALNSMGAWFGALAASVLERIGVLDRWSRFRARWFVPEARGALVLLALWPAALLFPAAVPFGVGQVFERLEAALAGALLDTPFLDWLPLREIELQPLVPLAELVCVMLGLLIPILLGYCVIRKLTHRAWFLIAVILAGLGTSALSAALSWGPEHAWAWFGAPAKAGLSLAVVSGLALLAAAKRVGIAVLLLALGVYLSLINQAPASAYFAQTLQAWEQGRFIRFHGVAQWLGWLWPYAALVYVFTQAWSRETRN
ncbi:VanZ family protein [Rhodoferax sp.]|uniref:VanZ family protein n=1 Tax=Rhodoferax sp. TaxID=50421 RepID=UPI00277AF7DD|nr:VanZ family protein [Rhodoferax sp.]